LIDEEEETEQAEASAQEPSEQEFVVRMKSVVNELSMHYPAKYKDLNKFELKTFDNLHKIIRSDSDWLDFTKLFMLYLEGILSLQDMFMLFEDKFGH
jgi:hypothetical protein